MFKNENKGIVFKARWFVRHDMNTDMTINFAWNDSGYALPSSFHLNNGRARVYIGLYKPSRFKNNTFIL